MHEPTIPAALILAGGLGLGAYHAGVHAALADRIALKVVAGSSSGAVVAAILAGNPPERRQEMLARFWQRVAIDTGWSGLLPEPLAPLRHAYGLLSAVGSRLTGVPGLFRPRLAPGLSLYDTSPLAETLAELVDFDRLNDGAVRCVIGTTDVTSGEAVWFDTARGHRIEARHILASGGLLPSFPPVEIDGRLLGDGGLVVNGPLEPLLASDRMGAVPPLCVFSDLFAPDAAPPTNLERSWERSNDLQFATQTLQRLSGLERERRLEARLEPDRPGTELVYLSYRPLPGEAGPEKQYDFSAGAIARRMRAGVDDAEAALGVIAALPDVPPAGLRIHRTRRADPAATAAAR